MTVSTSPFGVVVGSALLAAAALPLLVPDSTDDAALDHVERLAEQLAEERDLTADLAEALADANRALAHAGRQPVPATTPPGPASGPQPPSAGLSDSPAPTGTAAPSAVTEPARDGGGPAGGTTPPPSTPTTSPPTTPPTTAPPPPGGTPTEPPQLSVQCPPGTRPILQVRDHVRAWVCVPSR